MTLFMLITSDMQVLINYISFTESLFILMSIAALLWLRYRDPQRTRPIKVWIGFPILFFVICLFLVVLPIIQRPIELGVAIGIISIGIPVYYLGIHKEHSERFSNFMGEWEWEWECVAGLLALMSCRDGLTSLLIITRS